MGLAASGSGTRRPSSQRSRLRKGKLSFFFFKKGLALLPEPKILPARLIRHCYGRRVNTLLIIDTYINPFHFGYYFGGGASDFSFFFLPLFGPFLPVWFGKSTVVCS